MNNQEPEKYSDNPLLAVHSIFYTIQGEGPFSGTPAVFIRLAGCNLQCPQSDTDYTSGRALMNETWIINNVMEYLPDNFHSFLEGFAVPRPLVVITGGEPFRQNITPLLGRLLRNNFKVQIETNGTLFPDLSDELINYFESKSLFIVCSPKTGSINPDLKRYISAYKYVLSHDSLDDKDGLPLQVLGHPNPGRVARPSVFYKAPVYVMPADVKNNLEYVQNVKACKESALKYGYILQLQIHKIIGVE